METSMQDRIVVTSLDLNAKDIARYSLVRAIQCALTEGTIRADFEMECSQAISKRIRKATTGFFVPFEIQQRALSVTVPSAGGYLVGTKLQGASFIDLMRAAALPVRLGIKVLPLQGQPVSISRKIGGISGYWLAPGGEITFSDPEFDLLLSVPRTVASIVKYTREMLIQATPSFEALLVQDIASEFGTAISKACFHGNGDLYEPIGLERITGVGSIDGEDLNWDKIVDFESSVSNANADFERASWAMSPTTRALLRKLPKILGGDRFYIGDDNKMAGAPTSASNTITDRYLFYGDWSQALLIEYGIFEILVNPYTDALEGLVRLRGLQTVDVIWEHPDAFAMSDNVS
jgi:HK97 family phage major capsid protein